VVRTRGNKPDCRQVRQGVCAMGFDFEAVLTATESRNGGANGGPTIIAQNHDVNGINWARGLSDPGEMIACGYLPELRRQSGESDEAYNVRLKRMDAQGLIPADVKAAITKAAINRARLDTTGGRVNAAFANDVPWHGLGTIVKGAMTSADAIKLAGLDWQVIKEQLGYTFGGIPQKADAWATLRSDTGAQLGTVGSRYVPVQNGEGFEFLDSVIGEYGATYESAGSLYGGRSVWMLAHMPQHAFKVNGDAIEPYVCFGNSHDGTGAAWCYPTSVRVECANTFRTSNRDRVKGLSIRHTGSVQGKIAAARQALGLAVKGFEEFKEAGESLVNKSCDIRHYANDVLDAVLEMTAAKAAMGADVLASTLAVTQASRDLAAKSFERKIEHRAELLNDILERYESARCHPRGSAWAAFNAITEHADHSDFGRKVGTLEGRRSRRFESVMVGERDEMKQAAFAQAMAL